MESDLKDESKRKAKKGGITYRGGDVQSKWMPWNPVLCPWLSERRKTTNWMRIDHLRVQTVSCAACHFVQFMLCLGRGVLSTKERTVEEDPSTV